MLIFKLWYYNVWQRRKYMLRKVDEYKSVRGYHYYYCNLWCYLTDQHLCPEELFSFWLKRKWKHWIVTKNNALLGPFETRQGAEDMMRVVKGGRFWYGSESPIYNELEDKWISRS